MNFESDCRVSITLAIESYELTPLALTTILGQQPDRHWSMGDARGKTGKTWECHGWVIEVRLRSRNNAATSDLIDEAASLFAGRAKALVAGAASLRGRIQTYVVLSVVCDEVPGIEFSHSFLSLVVELGGTLQVDISAEGAQLT